jgi:hypothetical protein
MSNASRRFIPNFHAQYECSEDGGKIGWKIAAILGLFILIVGLTCFVPREIPRPMSSRGHVIACRVLSEAISCLHLPKDACFYSHPIEVRRAHFHKLHARIARLTPPAILTRPDGRCGDF